MKLAALLAIVILFAIAGCTSPEATRTRGGAGADIGNRRTIVVLHEGAEPFDKTPVLIPTKHPPLDGAYQAEQLSRR